MPASNRLDLFPVTTQVVDGSFASHLSVGRCDLAALAADFGTPLYVYDQATMDDAVDAYRATLQAHYPAEGAITYAGKAALFVAMAQWVERRGLWLDCTGVGEMYVADVAGMDRSRLLVHGVNKSAGDLEMAVETVGTIVVDNLSELKRLGALDASAEPEIWLRVRPGTAVDTHKHTQTGQADSKFGMSANEALAAVRLCLEAGLRVTGIHFHQGSHFYDPGPLRPAIETVLDLIGNIHSETGWLPGHLSPGGGWGIAYHEDDLPQPSIDRYVRFVAANLVASCEKRGLPLPALHLEPGRSLTARAGVAVYRVGTVKRTATRQWALLDGGIADNIRPALYGARYSALPVANPDRAYSEKTWLGGPYCESGDLLIEGLALPRLDEGELIAVPASGAYQLSMGSNYNGARRPAVVWLADGAAHLVRRRERVEDLTARDLSLPDHAFAHNV